MTVEQFKTFNSLNQEQKDFYNELEEEFRENSLEEMKDEDISWFLNRAENFTSNKIKKFHEWEAKISVSTEKFSSSQLAIIKGMIVDDYNMSQIMTVSYVGYDSELMQLIRKGIDNRFTPEEMSLLIEMQEFMKNKSKEAYDDLLYAIASGMDKESIKLAIVKDNEHKTILGNEAEQYAVYKIDERIRDINRIRQLTTKTSINDFQIMVLTDKRFSQAQKNELIKAIDSGISDENLFIAANPRFKPEQILEIVNAATHGLKPDELKIVASTRLDNNQMYMVYAGMRAGMTSKEAAKYMSPELSAEQMGEVVYGYADGLREDAISMFAKPEIPSEEMKNIRVAMEAGIKSGVTPETAGEAYLRMKEEQEECL